jgi:acyl-coenzyme A thioesterase 13
MNRVLRSFQAKIGATPGPRAAPFSRWLQGVIRGAEEGSVTVELVVREEMTNPAGLLHGGVQAAMIDEVIGMAVASLGSDTFYVSLNLSVDHLGYAKAGDVIRAIARIHRAGRRIINAGCELSNQAGQLIARGSSNLLKTEMVPSYIQRLQEREQRISDD